MKCYINRQAKKAKKVVDEELANWGQRNPTVAEVMGLERELCIMRLKEYKSGEENYLELQRRLDTIHNYEAHQKLIYPLLRPLLWRDIAKRWKRKTRVTVRGNFMLLTI